MNIKMEEVKKFVEQLNEAQKERFKELGYTNGCFFDGEDLTEQHKFNIKEKKKYIYIDCDTSGWFMVVRDTMEIFGIKAYGTIHKGKFYGKIGEVEGKDVYKLKLGAWF
jgi:hypothetical protein